MQRFSLLILAGVVVSVGLSMVSRTSLLPASQNDVAIGQSQLSATGTALIYVPLVQHQPQLPTATAKPTSTPVNQPPAATATPTAIVQPGTGVLETFEGPASAWRVVRDTGGGGNVQQSSARAASGSSSARLTTADAGGFAQLRVNFSDAATSHQWEERPGTFFWQRARIFVPSTTVNQLGANSYVTLAGLYPSAGGNSGWYLRVRQGGQLYVFGYTSNGKAVEFNAFATLPTDRWVTLELGLHSQAGPGTKRAFAFLLDGAFYGWYRQGNMATETFDRAAIGILTTSTAAALEVFVDEWGLAGSTSLPTGLDTRSTANVQEQDFRTLSGEQVQYDWSTWEFAPTLHPQYGVYSPQNRIQAGRNIDRMPDLASGWAEIEIDWPDGTPDLQPTSYFGPMVGFRKEVNREENLEVIPIGRGSGLVDLVFEAWTGTGVEKASWPLPAASVGSGSHIPEPGDIIRARWEQLTATTLNVRVSYYDASAGKWYVDVIKGDFILNNVPDADGGGKTINYLDGFHKASSITIDSPSYSIRRFKVGTLATYP